MQFGDCVFVAIGEAFTLAVFVGVVELGSVMWMAVIAAKCILWFWYDNARQDVCLFSCWERGKLLIEKFFARVR